MNWRVLLRLSGQLGWTPDQLWASTLPEFLFSWRGYQEHEKRADFRAGQMVAMLANVNRNPEKTPNPWTAADFFSSLRRLQPKTPTPSRAEMQAYLDELERTTTR